MNFFSVRPNKVTERYETFLVDNYAGDVSTKNNSATQWNLVVNTLFDVMKNGQIFLQKFVIFNIITDSF